IEWIVEEQYRAKNQYKDSVPIDPLRQKRREVAAPWNALRKGDFTRLGVVGDRENPYTGLASSADERIGAAPGKFLAKGRCAAALVEEVVKPAGIEAYSVADRFPGASLAGTTAAHPLRGQCYDFDVPLLAAGFVEADQGTGLVHIAPGHGADDFELGQMNGLAVPDTVSPDGFYLPSVPLFAGRSIYRA